MAKKKQNKWKRGRATLGIAAEEQEEFPLWHPQGQTVADNSDKKKTW